MPEEKTAIPIVDYFVNRRRKKNTKPDALDLMIEWMPVATKLDKTGSSGSCVPRGMTKHSEHWGQSRKCYCPRKGGIAAD